MSVDTPFEARVWPRRVEVVASVAAAAATKLARMAGADAEGLRTAYMALGLIPDPLHKPPTSRDKHYGRTK